MARPRNTDSMSIADLQRLIESRRQKVGDLRKEQKKLSKMLAKIEAQLSSVAGSSGGRRGSRPRNQSNLPDAIHAALTDSGKAMKVGDITEAVKKAGYSSSSANFRGIVNQALIKDKRFHAPERGTYGLKK